MKNEGGLAPGQRRIVVKEKRGIRIRGEGGGEGKVWAVYEQPEGRARVGLSSLDRLGLLNEQSFNPGGVCRSRHHGNSTLSFWSGGAQPVNFFSLFFDT